MRGDTKIPVWKRDCGFEKKHQIELFPRYIIHSLSLSLCLRRIRARTMKRTTGFSIPSPLLASIFFLPLRSIINKYLLFFPISLLLFFFFFLIIHNLNLLRFKSIYFSIAALRAREQCTPPEIILRLITSGAETPRACFI